VSGGIFISYRREDSSGSARGIYDRLARGLGRKNVFFDVDSIAPGVDFVELLTERVSVCDALVAVIGADWVSSVDRSNRRRIDNQRDFVRIEIEAALHRGVRVIPVLVDGATMPEAEDLPESLRKLVRLQGVEVSHTRFDTDVRKLTHTLRLWANQLRQQEAAEAERAAREERQRREAAEAARVEEARRLAEVEVTRLARAQGRAEEAAEAERSAREEHERREADEAARAEEARRLAEVAAARVAEEERRAQAAAEAERIAREERERQEATDLTRAEEARRKAEAEATRRAEEERGAQEGADAERAAREECERQEAAEAPRAEEARRLAEAEAARGAKDEPQAPDASEAEDGALEERERQEAAEAARAEEAQRPAEAAGHDERKETVDIAEAEASLELAKTHIDRDQEESLVQERSFAMRSDLLGVPKMNDRRFGPTLTRDLRAHSQRLIILIFGALLVCGGLIWGAQGWLTPSVKFYLLQLAALVGDSRAQYELGRDYYDGTAFGEAIAADWQKATMWLSEAANRGNAAAQNELGLFSSMLETSAKQGDPAAQYELGLIYENGWGNVGRDPAKALDFYQMAANRTIGRPKRL
jgi:TIR domain/Sel1 repeat